MFADFVEITDRQGTVLLNRALIHLVCHNVTTLSVKYDDDEKPRINFLFLTIEDCTLAYNLIKFGTP